MTALNFVIQEDQICLAMDTLSVAAEDREPLVFLTKYAVLPHLDMVVTGTGHGSFVAEWMHHARSNVIATDIDHLNQYTPDRLRQIAANHADLARITATIYHFGFSNARNRFLAYAYRSTKNWESEEILDGIGVKPPIDFLPGKSFELPATFIELIERQRKQDRSLPPDQRVGIGGDIHFVVMNRGGIHVSRCYRFPSYEQDFEAMCTRLDKI